MHPTAAKALRLLAGVVAANLVGAITWLVVIALMYGLASVRGPANAITLPLAGGAAIPSLVLVPIGMGFVAAFIWRPIGLGNWSILGLTFLTTALGLGGAYLLFKEGYVCLLIAAPVLFTFIFAGVLMGRRWFARTRSDRMNAFVLPLVFLAMVADARLRGSRDGVVVDEIVIRAAPSAVWKNVVAFPEIATPPRYWLNRVGLPSAVRTTSEGEFVGAKRECVFSNGVAFHERIAELETDRLLTFDIVEQPRDPELLGHIDLHRGQFQLQANADGTTTLIGRSWYTLRVRPLWYFDWWTRDITRHVHLRVMQHIKQLAEQG